MSETPITTASELIARMNRALDDFTAVLDTIDDADQTGPTDAAGWTVVDHVVHLCCWAEGVAALLRREPRWERMGIPEFDPRNRPPGFDFDLVNAALRDRNQGHSPADARNRLAAAHREVTEAVKALAEGELGLASGNFVAPFTEDIGPPIYERVVDNTAEHYEEHTPWILAILSR